MRIYRYDPRFTSSSDQLRTHSEHALRYAESPFFSKSCATASLLAYNQRLNNYDAKPPR